MTCFSKLVSFVIFIIFYHNLSLIKTYFTILRVLTLHYYCSTFLSKLLQFLYGYWNKEKHYRWPVPLRLESVSNCWETEILGGITVDCVRFVVAAMLGPPMGAFYDTLWTACLSFMSWLRERSDTRTFTLLLLHFHTKLRRAKNFCRLSIHVEAMVNSYCCGLFR